MTDEAAHVLHHVHARRDEEAGRSSRAFMRTTRIAFWICVTFMTTFVMMLVPYWLYTASRGITLEFLAGTLLSLIIGITVGGIIGTLLLCVPCTLVVFPISYALDNELRASAAQALGNVGSAEHLKGLADCSRSNHRSLSTSSLNSLRSILKRVVDSEPVSVPVGTAESLSRLALKHGDELDAQIFKVISWCGDGNILPWLSRMVEAAPTEENRQRAQHALECVQERMRQAKDQTLLLRPADQAEDHLLRPATATATPEEQLLRPLEGEA